MSGTAAIRSRGLPLEQATRVAVVGALSATTMLFASLVSAYLVRRSFDDWRPAPALWPFALLLFATIATVGMEVAARTAGRARRLGFQTLVLASSLYLAAAGAVIASTASSKPGLVAPHNAFVVLLLGVHVVHALAGAAFSMWTLRAVGGRVSEASLLLARLVTHFLTTLLFAIVFVLFVIR